MNIDIKLHKDDLPEDLNLGNTIAIDGEFMGLNVNRDPLCLLQISSGNMDAHIVQLNRETYKAPNLIKLLNNKNITKIRFSIFLKSSKIKFFRFWYLDFEKFQMFSFYNAR